MSISSFDTATGPVPRAPNFSRRRCSNQSSATSGAGSAFSFTHTPPSSASIFPEAGGEIENGVAISSNMSLQRKRASSLTESIQSSIDDFPMPPPISTPDTSRPSSSGSISQRHYASSEFIIDGSPRKYEPSKLSQANRTSWHLQDDDNDNGLEAELVEEKEEELESPLDPEQGKRMFLVSSAVATPTPLPMQTRMQKEVGEHQADTQAQLQTGTPKLVPESATARSTNPDLDGILADSRRSDLQRVQSDLSTMSIIDHEGRAKQQKIKTPLVGKIVNITKTKRTKSKDGAAAGLSPTTSHSDCNSMTMTESEGSFISRPSPSPQTPPPRVPAKPTYTSSPAPRMTSAPKTNNFPLRTDAPISGLDNGHRVVSVRCQQHNFILPVFPETTPVDIIRATAQNMNYNADIAVEDCIVWETFGSHSLFRRLRYFERIRDVMDSWERDANNHLLINIAQNPGADFAGLDLHSIDMHPLPRPLQFQLYHMNHASSKWSKRYVTLLNNGQMVCSKKLNTYMIDKETTSLCHLSDYDIYQATEPEMRKRLKPPKKFCYAIKSQSREAVFVDKSSYVQYFCTDDPGLASYFSEQVHDWRGRYLVERIPPVIVNPVPDHAPQIELTPSSKPGSPKKSVQVAAHKGHRLRVSIDETPYSIGEFEPLLDLKRFDKRLSEFGKDFITTETAKDLSSKKTVAMPAISEKDNKRSDGNGNGTLIDNIKSSDDGAFTGSGLIAHLDGGKPGNEVGGSAKVSLQESGGASPFTGGPTSLLSQMEEKKKTVNTTAAWLPSAQEHTARQRENEPKPPTMLNDFPNANRGPPSANRPDMRSYANQNHRSPLAGGFPNPLGLHHPRAPVPSSVHQAAMHSKGPRRQATLEMPSPKPLVSVSHTAQHEPAQWAKRNKGQGVQVPEGLTHLVDLISVGANTERPTPNGTLEAPRSAPLRRPANYPGQGPRNVPGNLVPGTRPKTSGNGSTPGPLIDLQMPHAPNLPGGGPAKSQDDMLHHAIKERIARDRARMMQGGSGSPAVRNEPRMQEREPARVGSYSTVSSGRAGTLRVV